MNFDKETVEGFGDEWVRFNQTDLSPEELQRIFQCYFRIFPWDCLSPQAVGFDLGCGSGRWAKLVAPRVGQLYCIDASESALQVARKNLRNITNVEFVHASVESIPIGDKSMDFGYSLGVLHHVPDTAAGVKSCVAKLKAGAPFLLYLYYAFDNRPSWYRLLWQSTNAARIIISRLPFGGLTLLTNAIAALIYYPLARTSGFLEKEGIRVDMIPLSAYRHNSFYTMRTDARDRFGTRLEQRFTAPQIQGMMEDSGLERIAFSPGVPFWCAIGYKKSGYS